MSDTILALLGFATVITVIVLLLRNVTVPALAFVSVSTITAAILVATGAFTLDEMAGFIKEGVKGVHGTAVLFIFSVLFFGVMTGADTGSKVQTALGIQAGGANENNLVRVALVKTENAKKDANLQAGIVVKGLVTAKVADTTHAVEPGKLGTAKTRDGKYMLVVIVNDISED